MPYINSERRDELYNSHENSIKDWPRTAGELNFLITIMCNEFVPENTYRNLNEVIGVLECVKQEFYRRVVVPYEEQKRLENGDVYE